jgi:hypothetical protein
LHIDVVIDVPSQIGVRGTETFKGIKYLLNFSVTQIKIFRIQIGDLFSERGNRGNRKKEVRDAVNQQDNGNNAEKGSVLRLHMPQNSRVDEVDKYYSQACPAQ